MKLIKVLLCILMMLNLVGCSGNKSSDDKKSGNEASEGIQVSTGDDSARIYNTVTNVKVTLPASLFEYVDEEISQEDLDKAAFENGFISATLNEDGSVTYVMSKDKYNAYVAELAMSIDKGLEELCNTENSTIVDIKHNADFTDYTITLDADVVGFTESFVSLAIVLYSAFYYGFTGKDMTSGVHFTYVNKSGDVLEEYSTDEMETNPVEEISVIPHFDIDTYCILTAN